MPITPQHVASRADLGYRHGERSIDTEIRWCIDQRRELLATAEAHPPFLLRLGLSDLLMEEVLLILSTSEPLGRGYSSAPPNASGFEN